MYNSSLMLDTYAQYMDTFVGQKWPGLTFARFAITLQRHVPAATIYLKFHYVGLSLKWTKPFLIGIRLHEFCHFFCDFAVLEITNTLLDRRKRKINCQHFGHVKHRPYFGLSSSSSNFVFTLMYLRRYMFTLSHSHSQG